MSEAQAVEWQGNAPFNIGTRQQLPSGELGRYTWCTYNALYKRVLSVGSALRRLGVQRGEFVGLLCDNGPEWVVTEQACHAYGLVSVPLWSTVGISYVEKLLNDSGVVAVVCSDRWTSALLQLACEGKVCALRLLVQLNTLGYDELVLKETLPPTRQLKLYDLGFVERMGECQRLPPSPSAQLCIYIYVYMV